MSTTTGLSASSYSGPDTPGLPTQQTENLPTPSLEALEFFNLLNEAHFKGLLFDDNLITISDTGKELGEFTVSISPAKYKGEECFLVHANSHGAIDNVPCGTAITTYVSKSLETYEQQHHEYVKLDNHPLDRKTFIVQSDGLYTINRIITQGEDVQRSSTTFRKEDMKGFVSEGSNLLLQRLLIKRGMPDNFQLTSLDSNASLCPVTYRSLDRRTQVVEQTELEVIGIERTINSLADLPTTWQSYFTKDGHLTSRVQVGSPVTMRLMFYPEPIEEEEYESKPVFEKKDLNWEEDVELHSKYSSRKEELKDNHMKYMREHPELKALMADFLQFLLLRKPTDTIAFAAEYFASFSSHMMSPTAYLDSAAPTPFPQSRSNSKIEYLTRT
ncbi:hypothetical protein LSH36_1g17002 [Paralvinella palmiformis]|uniref:Ciliogenesis-associated TTC17-interacting protein n=1 Tax=Paralvinella palmiformis TaxID=53620 RepID=A0AAD9NKP3_9ANNE|nr:hypothetical protein LSH36_1g17002 [Paralvinella palmiformis]